MKKTTPALLIVDMFSRFDFPEADLIASSALNASKAIARLRQHFKAEGDPVIYANDNFANWQMDFKELVQEWRRLQLCFALLLMITSF